MNKKNILVLTFGTSWQLIPEILGFTNPSLVNLYKNSSKISEILDSKSEHQIEPVDSIYIIMTDSEESKISLNKFKEWFSNFDTHIEIKVYISEGIKDLMSAEDCNYVGDLIYNTVLTARKNTNGGKLYLALSGGRKTMSADLQQAGNIFGSNVMIHIISTVSFNILKNINKEILLKPLEGEYKNAFIPIITSGVQKESYLLEYEKIADKLLPSNEVNIIPNSTSLIDKIKKNMLESSYLMFNYAKNLSQEDNLPNFPFLYSLSPEIVKKLKRKRVDFTSDIYKILKKMPKTELHCHMGGVLNTNELIEVALANKKGIERYINESEDYRKWIKELELFVSEDNLTEIKERFPNIKDLRKFIKNIPEPFNVVGFIFAFRNNSKLLDKYIFNEFINPDKYRGIGISEYEQLGDLQGSGILQSKESLIKTCKIIKKKALEDNIIYWELRISPYNYTRGGLSVEDVIDTIKSELNDFKKCYFNMIFIGSRHGKISDIYRHIELAENLVNDERYRICGFDLAGNENAKEAKELHSAFLPLMKQSMNITIHAGETVDVGSIWQAVYILNADRIGHGLTLKNNRKLMNRFRGRNISIEMCPSSNDQIIGFRNYYKDKSDSIFKKIYPLKEYLDYGLRVTINSDNLGISRTTLTDEYIKVSELTENSLTIWEIIQIIKNGFDASFADYNIRKIIVKKAEEEIGMIIKAYFI